MKGFIVEVLNINNSVKNKLLALISCFMLLHLDVLRTSCPMVLHNILDLRHLDDFWEEVTIVCGAKFFCYNLVVIASCPSKKRMTKNRKGSSLSSRIWYAAACTTWHFKGWKRHGNQGFTNQSVTHLIIFFKFTLGNLNWLANMSSHGNREGDNEIVIWRILKRTETFPK